MTYTIAKARPKLTSILVDSSYIKKKDRQQILAQNLGQSKTLTSFPHIDDNQYLNATIGKKKL